MEPQATPEPLRAPALGEPPPAGPTDGALVEACIGGKRTAFDELVRRYQRQAVAVSYRLLGNSHDALD